MNVHRYRELRKSDPVAPGFSYDSGSNHDFLSVEGIRHLIRAHIDPEFEPA